MSSKTDVAHSLAQSALLRTPLESDLGVNHHKRERHFFWLVGNTNKGIGASPMPRTSRRFVEFLRGMRTEDRYVELNRIPSYCFFVHAPLNGMLHELTTAAER